MKCDLLTRRSNTVDAPLLWSVYELPVGLLNNNPSFYLRHGIPTAQV
jgi:hypothetical protein